MAGLVPAIHVSSGAGDVRVDARDKPGHDELWRARKAEHLKTGQLVTTWEAKR
jgi:hypothetical protein